MSRITGYLEKYGVPCTSVVKALICFKALSYGTWFTLIGISYRYKPLQKLVKNYHYPKILFQKIKTKYPNAYTKTKTFILEKSEKLSESRFFKPIPRTLCLESKRFTIALAEGSALCKILLPITLPSQIWFTIWLYKTDNNKSHELAIIINDTIDVLINDNEFKNENNLHS